MLRLTISQNEARLAAYFLALQILVNIIFGYFGGSFMVIARSHRGTHWNNIQKLTILVATASVAWLHSSFAMVALATPPTLVCAVASWYLVERRFLMKVRHTAFTNRPPDVPALTSSVASARDL